jgi:hypothetical protein
MRPEVQELVAMGPLPDSASAAGDMMKLEEYGRLLDAISKPVSDEEAEALVRLFGPDDGFGLAWTLVHLIESAPGWPFVDRLPAVDNEWIALLRDRSSRRA